MCYPYTICKCPGKTGSCDPSKTDNIRYTGPNLPFTGIETNDNTTLVIQKLNDAIEACCTVIPPSTTTIPPTTSTTTTIGCLTFYAMMNQVIGITPTLTIIKNEIGGTVALTRTNPGAFTLTFTNPNLPVGNVPTTYVNIGQSTIGLPGVMTAFFSFATNIIGIFTQDSDGANIDGVLGQTPIQVTVCPPFTTTSTTTVAPTTTTSTTHLTTTTTTTVLVTTTSSSSSTSTSSSSSTTTSTTTGTLFRVDSSCCTPPDLTEKLVNLPTLPTFGATATFTGTDNRGYKLISSVAVNGTVSVTRHATDTTIYASCAAWSAAHVSGCPTTTTTSSSSTTTTTTTENILGTNFLPVDNAFTVLYGRVYDSSGTYVVGSFTSYRNPSLSSSTANRIARIDTGLNLVGAFTTGGFDEATPTVTVIRQQTDNRIIAAGAFTSYNGIPINDIARINTNGTLDNTFALAGSGFNSPIKQIDIEPSSGGIYIVGSFTSLNGTTQNRVAKVTSSGALDVSYDVGTGFNQIASGVNILSDGNIMIVGHFTTYKGVTTLDGIVKTDTNGAVQVLSAISGFSPVNQDKYIARIPGQTSFYVGGAFSSYAGTAVGHIIKLGNNGLIDGSFNPIGAGFNAQVTVIEVVWTDKLFVMGDFDHYNGFPANGVIVLNADGTVLFGSSIRYYTPIIIGDSLYARTITGSLRAIFTKP